MNNFIKQATLCLLLTGNVIGKEGYILKYQHWKNVEMTEPSGKQTVWMTDNYFRVDSDSMIIFIIDNDQYKTYQFYPPPINAVLIQPFKDLYTLANKYKEEKTSNQKKDVLMDILISVAETSLAEMKSKIKFRIHDTDSMKILKEYPCKKFMEIKSTNYSLDSSDVWVYSDTTFNSDLYAYYNTLYLNSIHSMKDLYLLAVWSQYLSCKGIPVLKKSRHMDGRKTIKELISYEKTIITDDTFSIPQGYQIFDNRKKFNRFFGKKMKEFKHLYQRNKK